MGVTRSNGCLLCVKRRVKCDERVPGCARCETYGRPCPGFDRGFQFVAGKPYRSRRRPKTEESSSQDETNPASVEFDTDVVSQAAYQLQTQASGPLSLISADSNVLQGLDIVLDEVSQPYQLNSAYVISRWLRFLPGVYGRNRTLDSAIKCFVSHHVGNVAKNQQALWYARSTYVEALARLRNSLDNPAEGLSSEMFCAVLLLCMYEVGGFQITLRWTMADLVKLFANTTDSVSWMKHAQALSQLTEIRGFGRYVNEFDLTLLKASRGLIVMHSLFSGQKCFLTSRSWHSVMEKHVNTGLLAELDRLVEEFFAFFTFAPSFIHELYDLKQTDLSDPRVQQRISNLATRSFDMINKVSAWYEQFSTTVPLPTQARSSTGDKLFPIVLIYSDVNSGTLFCGYYSYMLLLHEILRACGCPGEHAAMVVHFRDLICQSIEYNTRGMLGPYRMGFSLRAVYETADPVTRAWLEGWLERLSKAYAAVQPRNFGMVD
ncbi:Zn(II)2Cys6 transcription factor domain-containing protein [Aspergillus affinis]|uniref:Zn(II)2Cys6 transcription factor domain-containing protein n=1 Tax=Aspergillus affinis TaxID=1070780 RepID=UPI0022FE4A64|nr:C6 zinc finger domain protein [Aspergillus affinis]KAI9045450.1 C6 zinc finger domain protein [Aspergillus affinis]